ncbi:MAG: phosphate ABC transporter permease PstA [Treponema sp.]|nr:phosphate ABC transporter permease PstA [Treponema sp.]
MKFATKRRITDGIMYALMSLGLAGVLATLLFILAYVFSHAAPFLGPALITDPLRGIFPMIVTTLYVVLVSVAGALPVGIATAIFLNEYAVDGKRIRLLRLAIDTLAGIPSIIYGLFGLLVFSRVLGFGQSILSGGLTLSIMILPVIIRTTEEALKSIPVSVREGSLSLGATKFQTVLHVVLPPSMPGIVTALILAVGRVIGESAPVLLTVGLARNLPRSVLDSGRTLSIHLYQLTGEALHPDDFGLAFATAGVLIVIVVLINTATKLITLKFRKDAENQ